ncbi:hypothetical protein Tco_0086648 [Tanacetum coccineum]
MLHQRSQILNRKSEQISGELTDEAVRKESINKVEKKEEIWGKPSKDKNGNIYPQKDKNKAKKLDKPEHGIGKSVENQSQRRINHNSRLAISFPKAILEGIEDGYLFLTSRIAQDSPINRGGFQE